MFSLKRFHLHRDQVESGKMRCLGTYWTLLSSLSLRSSLAVDLWSWRSFSWNSIMSIGVYLLFSGSNFPVWASCCHPTWKGLRKEEEQYLMALWDGGGSITSITTGKRLAECRLYWSYVLFLACTWDAVSIRVMGVVEGIIFVTCKLTRVEQIT